jgi:hypothetical protein
VELRGGSDGVSVSRVLFQPAARQQHVVCAIKGERVIENLVAFSQAADEEGLMFRYIQRAIGRIEGRE